MLDEKHLSRLSEKFNSFSNNELLILLTDERHKYSQQAIESADYIAKERGLEYEIPELIEEVPPRFPRYVDVGFILLSASVIGLQFYLSSIRHREFSEVIGSTIRDMAILYLSYKSVPPSKYAFVFLALTVIALFCAIFGQIIIAVIIVGLMFLLKSTVFKTR